VLRRPMPSSSPRRRGRTTSSVQETEIRRIPRDLAQARNSPGRHEKRITPPPVAGRLRDSRFRACLHGVDVLLRRGANAEA
jgi:hypothetical protein